MESKNNINNMHFGASAFTFQKAEEFRINMTEAEKILWDELRNKKLDGLKFRRQHPISRFIVDFYCHSLKLVIELDGSIHNETLVRENDLNRQAEIEALGIKVLRFKNMDVILNISKVITEIREMA
jgi:imidazole glycerol-phosphate synthase subunit HisF